MITGRYCVSIGRVSMTAYYNEFDPFAAAWLRELIKDGLIADGIVDERSIADVRPKDLEGFTQCHFFAGIGGWSAAARLAGWGDDRPMWTGSPPCQPFSTAGNRKGKEDERHLWPVFFNLIRECAPSVVFGEQVAAAIKTGWFDDLQADMEAEGYATGMVVLPACSVGAAHKRDRLWYVAELADTTTERSHNQADKPKLEGKRSDQLLFKQPRVSTVAYTNSSQREGERLSSRAYKEHNSFGSGSASNAAWDDSTAIYCRDGKYRPIPAEPALFPLAHGIPNRVGLLRGAGNAIVPQVAAEIIKAYMG